jgi:hypothetical protein
MDLAKIIRIVGVVLAVAAGVVAIPQSAMLIAIVGLVGGYFVEEDRRVPFMVLTLTLALSHGALGAIPGVGDYLTAILGSLSSLLNAGACTVIVMQIVERVKP